ncbi:MAG TPA: hypothetical protein VD861_13685, partial [Pyrinomonadaceae bacterium]|nr:hypothetical protein [Pyrinomonadaceae bacterium]
CVRIHQIISRVSGVGIPKTSVSSHEITSSSEISPLRAWRITLTGTFSGERPKGTLRAADTWAVWLPPVAAGVVSFSATGLPAALSA